MHAKIVAYGVRGEGLVWLIGAVLCLLSANRECHFWPPCTSTCKDDVDFLWTGCTTKYSEVHGSNKGSLRFLFRSRFTFLTFLTGFLKKIFDLFYLKKTLSNAKYEYAKIQRKILLEDALAMIFIGFGLLRSLYCKISYLLAEEHWLR